jgi:hypothetical protein
MLRYLHLFALAGAFAVAPHAWAQCSDKRAIWTHQMGDVKHVVFGTEGVNYASKIYFEEWRGDKLAWRGGGEVTCSNGASTCYGLIRNHTGGEATTDVVLEQIDENQDGIADWVIFAGLSQALWYSEGLEVDWFNGFKREDPSDRIQASNIYKLSGCRERDELVLTAIAPN